jgi:hypothetical protein
VMVWNKISSMRHHNLIKTHAIRMEMREHGFRNVDISYKLTSDYVTVKLIL